MNASRPRFPALILLLALLGGGFGLPLADALLFHGDPGARPLAERILTGGSQAANHVQVCHLADATGPERSLASRAQLSAFALPCGPTTALALDERFVASSDFTLPLSRGPPPAA